MAHAAPPNARHADTFLAPAARDRLGIDGPTRMVGGAWGSQHAGALCTIMRRIGCSHAKYTGFAMLLMKEPLYFTVVTRVRDGRAGGGTARSRARPHARAARALRSRHRTEKCSACAYWERRDGQL